MSEEKQTYLVPGENPIEQAFKKAYWDMFFQNVKEENNYDILTQNIEEIKEMLKNLIPNRSDIHEKEFNEYIDVPFIKQKFEHNVFKQDDFIGLFIYIIDWIKKLGCADDEKEVDLFKETVIKVVKEKGHLYVLPYAFDAMHTQVTKITEMVELLMKGVEDNHQDK